MTSLRAADLVRKLALQPHPEGGWYREIFRSPTRVETARGPRSALTTIYYLLERNQLSRWHVVQADEVWHFYAGAPLELVAYVPDTRTVERHVLGHVGGPGAGALGGAGVAGGADATAGGADATAGGADATAGGRVGPVAGGRVASVPGESGAGAIPVAVIPTGVWQAARSLGEYSLVGCTVGPGFEFADFQFVSALPSHAEHFCGELTAHSGLL